MSKILDLVFTHDRATKESWAMGLALKCPHIDFNSPHCQLYDARKNKNHKELMELVRSLSDDELNVLLIRHANCIHND